MSQPIIKMTSISKNFAGVQALKEVQFDLYPGEVHAILGENGAGKSTLIKIITGVHQPTSGQIELHGQQIQFADPRESRGHGIAAIYQEPSLFPDLDIAENIFVGRQPIKAGGRIDWGTMYSEAATLLETLGVELNPKTKARDLSVAQQQMVEIARALSVSAQILIMDEPTSSLTLSEVEDLFRIVHRLREGGTAIVFISHRLEDLFELADRVTVLRDGSYVDTRSMAGITTEQLIQMMVGRTLDDLFPKQDVEAGNIILKVEELSVTGIFSKVSFELRRGEILGMAGLVGAGRTDVARSIFGITPATGGQIIIDGQPVSITSPRQAMDLGLAYVPEDRQHHGLVLPMPIAYNITLPKLADYAAGGWIKNGNENQAAQNAATQLAVKASSIWQKGNELSGGNQQKVVLAKWLSTKPRVLILDEPTRGIDVGTKAAVHGLMSQLAAEGIAIIMISSELPEILGMSDRILVMREGHLTAQMSRDEATQEKIMLAATQSVEEPANVA
jgi:rhamnose transport system ATP-binding protein